MTTFYVIFRLLWAYHIKWIGCLWYFRWFSIGDRGAHKEDFFSRSFVFLGGNWQPSKHHPFDFYTPSTDHYRIFGLPSSISKPLSSYPWSSWSRSFEPKHFDTSVIHHPLLSPKLLTPIILHLFGVLYVFYIYLFRLSQLNPNLVPPFFRAGYGFR